MEVRVRQTPDARISQIMAEARALLEEVGYERFQPKLVAERCGISEATVYRYFRTRHELLTRVAEAWFEEILSIEEPELEGVRGTYDRLHYVVRYALNVIRHSPSMTRFILLELRAEPGYRATPLYELNRRFTGVVTGVLREAVEAGDFAGDVSVTLLRDMIFGAVEHQTWAYLRGEGDFSVQDSARGITDVLYRGMVARIAA
ncbi:MAG TPA: TetR/AcrR family transcriptional regulator [Solirubrobacteraceae bacterium]|nr:TetR/AcrR family transcriptional regulator [Solirubrobacteraceae bacterium]